MSGGRRRRAGWLAWWRRRARHHAYTCEGYEHVRDARPALVVGYHGRAAAFDMGMLIARLHDEEGELPWGLAHRGLFRVPMLRWLVEPLHLRPRDDPELAAALRRGARLFVTPGGDLESTRGPHDRYRVAWGERRGYLRLAARHRLPIVPVGAAGVDDTYVILWSGLEQYRRGRLPFPPVLGHGRLGLIPLAAPYRVRIHQRIGAPIHLDFPADPPDRPWLDAAHARVSAAVQQQVDLALDDLR